MCRARFVHIHPLYLTENSNGENIGGFKQTSSKVKTQQNNRFTERTQNHGFPTTSNKIAYSQNTEKHTSNIRPIDQIQNIDEIQRNSTFDGRYFRSRVLLHRMDLTSYFGGTTETQNIDIHSSTTVASNSSESAILLKRKPRPVQRFTYSNFKCLTCHRNFTTNEIPHTASKNFVCSVSCLR